MHAFRFHPDFFLRSSLHLNSARRNHKITLCIYNPIYIRSVQYKVVVCSIMVGFSPVAVAIAIVESKQLGKFVVLPTMFLLYSSKILSNFFLYGESLLHLSETFICNQFHPWLAVFRHIPFASIVLKLFSAIMLTRGTLEKGHNNNCNWLSSS